MHPHDAESALRVADAARAAASRRHPPAPWRAPATSLLVAAGFVNLALLEWHPRAWAFLAAALVCLAAVPVPIVVASRVDGTVAWPSGPPGARARRQLPVLVPFVAGGIAAAVAGLAAATAVWGVCLGAVTWFQLARPAPRASA
jgi:hypothetical protein